MNSSNVLIILYIVCIALHSGQTLRLEYWQRRSPEALNKTTNHIYLRAFAILSLILSVPPIVTSARQSPPSMCQDGLDVNADIGGIGVLLGLFWPAAALKITLVLGHRKTETSGAKELCLAHMANLIYLGVNLAKAMAGLNRMELIIAYSSVDAVAASIAVAFSDKDVVAARMILIIGTLLQFAAFGLEAATIVYMYRSPPICRAIHPTLSAPQGFAWAFWAARILATMSILPTIQRIAPRIHALENTSSQGPNIFDAKVWLELPATLFTNYLIHFSIGLIQAASAIALTCSNISESWTSLWTEWGQSAPLIVAIAAGSHVLYSFSRLFCNRAVEERFNLCEASINRTARWPERWRTTISEVSWKSLSLRSPFNKIRASPTDELLFRNTILLTYNQRQELLDDIGKRRLWEELRFSFENNDIQGIKDCLERGAPLDIKDTRGEYVIHMAARFGDVDILKQYFTGVLFTQMTVENDGGETPLMIAHRNHRVPAIHWILKQKPADWPSQPRWPADEDVRQIISYAINKEMVAPGDLLDIITNPSLLPHWEDVNPDESPFMEAVSKAKLEAAKCLLPRLKQPLYRGPSSGLIMLSHINRNLNAQVLKTLIDKPFNFWTDRNIASSAAMTCLDLDIMSESIATQGDLDQIEILINSDLPLKYGIIHYIYQTQVQLRIEDDQSDKPSNRKLVTHVPGERMEIEEISEQRLKTLKKTLESKGALNYGPLWRAIRTSQANTVQVLLENAKDMGNSTRLLNNMMYNYNGMGLWATPLDLVLLEWTSRKKPGTTSINKTIQLMIKMGAVLFPPPSISSYIVRNDNAMDCILITDCPKTTFLVLLKQARKENVQRAFEVAEQSMKRLLPDKYSMLGGFLEKDRMCRDMIKNSKVKYYRVVRSLYYLLSHGAKPNIELSFFQPAAQQRLEAMKGHRTASPSAFSSELEAIFKSMINRFADTTFSGDTDYTELEFLNRPDDFDENTLTGWL
ncbi:hypothetical protein BU24DRAFT_425617 [Aaosphaeria arxii CBS 175.79]|uniref:Uncharacterized protein n=1 Tax=Aaosphaeria arxii CBS 175.79 TaxID=1450172 RepID=A0A6A5XJB9_9PLEO|nr:uncharacterized protein BU24DRAFT_425617 [Aaosphaeria arxii CBS 175.79]KAF2013053.1 hypothetical protein BU24DRAFT_425617 [Aaosphaeria arxii CBS 175.79]